ncbi:hypothetical protein AEYBE204_13035 [Asticcacaulis sp. YBE204]|nr:hypothetical protein AEYBE204_13035 [Asticcacaulis sp. YBE204]
MPNAESVILISEALEVRPNWLVLGRGARSESATIIAAAEAAPRFIVPLLDTRLSAGAGVLATENQIGEIILPPEVMAQLHRTDTKGLYMFESTGDSMYPTISDPAYVLVDTNQNRMGEAVYAFRMVDDLRIKRLRRVGLGDIEAMSDNPMYPPERIEGPEKEHFGLIGRVVWAGSVL